MDWQHLLSKTRYDDGTGAPRATSIAVINDFQDDSERILYTPSFRRLQGKTQVYPFPRYDYLRHRLTHTVEVAHVGRIIASSIARSNQLLADIPDVVYAACLAHDLGNPPFGHIGEHAIQSWFGDDWQRKVDPHGMFTSVLQDKQYMNDFLCFDGNAQGFRVLTRLSSWRQRGGMQLTHAVLGAFSKYPHPSIEAPNQKNKFGFMSADAKAAEVVFRDLGLNETSIADINGDQIGSKFCRHPLAFVVEAADDISYLTTDVEDAHRMGRAPYDSAFGLLEPIASAGNRLPRWNLIKTASPRDRIAYIRAGAANALIQEVVSVFANHEQAIRKGNFYGSLIDASRFNADTKRISEYARSMIYTEEYKLQTEVAGYTVIMTLMDLFGGTIVNLMQARALEKLTPRNRGIYNLLPREFADRLSPTDGYENLLTLVDYISGMTDRFAVELYQKLVGSSVSIGRMM